MYRSLALSQEPYGDVGASPPCGAGFALVLSLNHASDVDRLAGSLVLVLLVIGGTVWAQSRSGQGSDNDAAEGFVASEATSSTVRFTRTTAGNSDAQVAATNEPVADETTTSQPSTSTSEATTATTEPVESTTTTIAVDPDLVATISNISLADGRYIVEYTTSFSLLISSDPESHHLHF